MQTKEVTDYLRENLKRFKNQKGVHYIMFLIEKPNFEHTYLEVYLAVNGKCYLQECLSIKQAPIPTTDMQTIREIQQRLDTINKLFDKPTSATAMFAEEKIIHEKAMLEKYLSEVYVNGKIKVFQNEYTRCKNAIVEAIRLSCIEIKRENQQIYKEIKNRMVKRKNTLSYNTE
jgi:hypothetical protein